MSRRAPLILLTLLLGAATVLIGHVHAVSQRYYPVVKVAAPDGVTFLALLAETSERPACSEANRRFLAPLKASCAQCEIVFARCERELDGVELALEADGPLPYPVVRAAGLRLAIGGNAEAAQAACGFIALDVQRRRLGAASCEARS
jgi:hypothetical protein